MNAPIPMDPVEVEALAPADLDACEKCDGLGVVVVGFEQDTNQPIDEDCRACDGSGSRHGWVLGGAA